MNGVKYTYEYLNGQLMRETRGEQYFDYYYDANGQLYAVSYQLTPGGEKYAYYFTHNWRGDIMGIYNGNGDLKATYSYDSWGNVTGIKDADGAEITNPNHVANLNPFRYRGYYMDTETGLYYLMSRYYDPVTHRFVNSDGYFQSGNAILDANMNAYCRNNPITNIDPTGTITINEMQRDIADNPNSCWTIKDVTRAYLAGFGPNDEIDYLGSTSNGHQVYISTTVEKPSYIADAYWVYDYRSSKSDPGVRVIESHLIDQMDIKLEIIDMLIAYEEANPSEWSRTRRSMLMEWDVHNKAYDFNIRTKSSGEVDLNNGDEFIYSSLGSLADPYGVILYYHK